VRHADNHTHGEAAQKRSESSAFGEMLAMKMGLNPYFPQRSRSDERNGREGYRDHHWIKDLTSKATSIARKPNQMLLCIDIDEYIDMNDFLGSMMQPVFIYTFQPRKVGEDKGDFNFTFNSYNEIEYIVNGGATYVHTVWNYNCDNVVVEIYSLGILVRAVAYLVDKRQVDQHHQMILLTPIYRWIFPFSYLTWLLRGPRFGKLEVVDGEYTVMYVKHANGVNISIGKVGYYQSCDLPVGKFESLLDRHKLAKEGLTHAQVKTTLKINYDEDVDFTANICNYIRDRNPKRPTLTFGAEFSRDYQFVNRFTDDDAKPSMVSFMNPVVDGAFAPALSEANNLQAVHARILEVRTNVPLEPFFAKCAREFMHMMNCKNKLYPVDVEVVYERQNRPTQRAILKAADLSLPQRVVKAFMKREAYQKLSDPRVICTIDSVDKLEFSTYVYALDDLLSSFHWYAFGKTPRMIAERIAEVAQNASFIIMTDLSRFDGRYSQCLRDVCQMFMLHVFHRSLHKRLISLNEKQDLMKCHMGDITWTSMDELHSGKPQTSVFGTLSNAFIAFCAMRVSKLDAEAAWRKLGLYGGDDGVSADINAKTYKRVAVRFGQVLDAMPIKRGELGVQFLNRQYGPYVWDGDTNSCCNIMRAMTKFHVTTNMPLSITPIMKLEDKAYAYYLSDSQTPLLGDFVSKVCNIMEQTHPTFEFKNITKVYNAFFEISEQYPNAREDWMFDLLAKQTDVEIVHELMVVLDKITNLYQCLNMTPLRVVEPMPHPTQDIVVDGDLLVSQVVMDKFRRSQEKKNKKTKKPRGNKASKSQVAGQATTAPTKSKFERNEIKN
jgi:hypothetical protein